MKIELHLHTNRYSQCSVVTPEEVMRRLVEEGYGAVCITEHHAMWSDGELEALRNEFPCLRIFPGVELNTGNGDLLVLGTNDAEYLALREEPAKIILKARSQGLVTILAHPFRWEISDNILKGPVLPDAIEHRTCNHDAKAAGKAAAAAQRLNLPLVNAGDVHSLEMAGKFWIETDRQNTQRCELREIIVRGEYRNCEHGEM